MVEHELPKLIARVRFPSSAPRQSPRSATWGLFVGYRVSLPARPSARRDGARGGHEPRIVSSEVPHEPSALHLRRHYCRCSPGGLSGDSGTGTPGSEPVPVRPRSAPIADELLPDRPGRGTARRPGPVPAPGGSTGSPRTSTSPPRPGAEEAARPEALGVREPDAPDTWRAPSDSPPPRVVSARDAMNRRIRVGAPRCCRPHCWA